MSEKDQPSSLFTKGSNPGPHASAIGTDYDTFLHRQIAEEWRDYEANKNRETPVDGSPRPGQAPQRLRNQRTLQDFRYENVDVKKRRFTFTWDFSLNEAAADPSVTIKKIQKFDWPSFQMKPVGTKHAPVHDQKRQGALDGLIWKSLTVKQVQTSSVEPLAIVIDGIKGNNYGIGSGIRTPFVINPESNAYGINEVIHELDESLMKMADLRYTKMSEDYLAAQAVPLPGNPNMCSVPVDSDLTDVLRQQKNPLIPSLKEIPVFADGTHYVLHTKLAQKCINMLLEKRGNVSLPTTNVYDWKIGVVKANGEKWDNTNVAKRMSDKTGLVGQDLLDLPITVTLVVEGEFFLISENWDQKRTMPQ
jgi:hypothetical protein